MIIFIIIIIIITIIIIIIIIFIILIIIDIIEALQSAEPPCDAITNTTYVLFIFINLELSYLTYFG